MGESLEQLYAAYFAIQQSLAGDEKPSEEQATALHQEATALVDAAGLPEPAREQLRVIATSSEHLHHLPIETARLEAFRPISHAVVRLAVSCSECGCDGAVLAHVLSDGERWRRRLAATECRTPQSVLGQPDVDLRGRRAAVAG